MRWAGGGLQKGTPLPSRRIKYLISESEYEVRSVLSTVCEKQDGLDIIYLSKLIPSTAPLATTSYSK